MNCCCCCLKAACCFICCLSSCDLNVSLLTQRLFAKAMQSSVHHTFMNTRPKYTSRGMAVVESVTRIIKKL